MICEVRLKPLTGAERDELLDVYREVGLSQAVQLALYETIDRTAHIELLNRAVLNHPGLVIPQHACDILEGSDGYLRRVGLAAYKALSLGTDCQCCQGWRLILLSILAVYGAGAVFSRLL